jgi:hypothetical protein
MPDYAQWSMTVRNMLSAGFGVEDIHIALRRAGVIPNQPDHIRALIKAMRAEGTLLKLYRRSQ